MKIQITITPEPADGDESKHLRKALIRMFVTMNFPLINFNSLQTTWDTLTVEGNPSKNEIDNAIL